jgi:hypothetical protein
MNGRKSQPNGIQAGVVKTGFRHKPGLGGYGV